MLAWNTGSQGLKGVRGGAEALWLQFHKHVHKHTHTHTVTHTGLLCVTLLPLCLRAERPDTAHTSSLLNVTLCYGHGW